jgi:hypothetical protein
MLKSAYKDETPEADDKADLKKQGDLWWQRGHVFVPLKLQPGVLKQFHDDPLAGHLGSMKTLNLLGWTVTWPGIQKDVVQYTKSCFSCQRAKHSTQKPPGSMHSLQILDRPWSCIGINFVVKLPISSGFDSILVIVNHFTKGVHLILAKETWSAEEFASLFFACFIRLHGLPDKIVSDRGSLFVSKFWKEVQQLLHVKDAPLTAWHPCTDGQTERANQTVEMFL